MVRKWLGAVYHATISPARMEYAAWGAYSKGVRLVARLSGVGCTVDPDFAKRGFKQGVLPAEEMAAFVRSLESAPRVRILEDDHIPGYVWHRHLKVEESEINTYNTYIAIGEQQRPHLEKLLKNLAAPIQSCLGTPWRVVNTRVWETHPSAYSGNEEGFFVWHTDHFPKKVLKIMLYPKGMGPRTGTTRFLMKDKSTLDLEGPENSWMVFKNSEILHRAVGPQDGHDRLIIEITIMPSLTHDQRPVVAGLNAKYPAFPPMGAIKE